MIPCFSCWFASSAIRCCRVDTTSEFDASWVFPISSSVLPAPSCDFPFPTPRLPVRPVHRLSNGTMGVLRLPKILLQPVVASRSDTTAVSIVFVLSPLRPPAVTRHPSPRAGSCSTGLPPVPLTVETSGSPRFLGSHTYRSAPLLDPGRASLPGLLSAVPFCPRFNNHEGPFDLPRFRGSLTRLSGSLSTLPPLRYLRRARLASGWWPTSFRVGLVTHMAPLKGFRSILSSQGITSPFPRLRLAPCLCGLSYFRLGEEFLVDAAGSFGG